MYNINKLTKGGKNDSTKIIIEVPIIEVPIIEVPIIELSFEETMKEFTNEMEKIGKETSKQIKEALSPLNEVGKKMQEMMNIKINIKK